jgi:hypothetical protein
VLDFGQSFVIVGAGASSVFSLKKAAAYDAGISAAAAGPVGDVVSGKFLSLDQK